jgi:hypothetical protein
MKEKRKEDEERMKKKEKRGGRGGGEWGQKKQNKGAKNQIIRGKPQMVGRKKKRKKRVFTRWQLNLSAPVKFAWPCWMMTKMD